MLDYEIYTLQNGIRVVHKQVNNTKIAHCGFILDIGGRDELPHQLGIAHFWEHMAFKGTKKRKAYHILNRLDSVGGELNAYTTKEKICFHASVLEKHFNNAVELLADITFDSVFPEKQIENEKSVILEEMAMYLDAPEDAIQDEFDQVVFGEHPLGHNLLGTQESVRSFHRDHFNEFIAQNLDSERLIFSSVGPMPLSRVVKQVERYIAHLPRFTAQRSRLAFGKYTPRFQVMKRHLSQAQCAIGATAYEIGNPKRMPFFLLANILGGPGMNTRLNMALREKYGFVYSIDANYHSFTDTGLFAIFFGTEPKQLKKSIQLVHKEIDLMRNKALGTMQLHKAKEQLLGQLAMAEENNIGLMLMMGKSLLDLNKIDSLDSVFESVNKVTSSQIMEVANEILHPDRLSLLTYEPEK